MRLNARVVSLAGAAAVFALCLGATNPFKDAFSSPNNLQDRVTALEKENAALRSELQDLERKLEVLAQRVNSGGGATAGYQAPRAPMTTPNLEVVRVSPAQAMPAEPARPKAQVVVTSSDASGVTLVENGQPLPGTNDYIPLPDPAATPEEKADLAPAAAPAKPAVPAALAPAPTPIPAGGSPEEAVAYERIKKALEAGPNEEALGLMEAYLAAHPIGSYSAEVADRLGSAYFEKGKYPEAIAAYKVVTEKHFQSQLAPQALYQIGLSYLELGQADKAKEALGEVKILYPFSDAAKMAEEKLSTLSD